MELNFRQEPNLKQVQQLKLTASVVQAIELLTLTREDLISFIKKEAEENPLLEVHGLEDEYYNSLHEMTGKEEMIRWQKYAEYLGDYSYRQSYTDASEKENNLERYVSQPLSLFDFLKEQLIDIDDENLELEILEYLITCLDGDGYFRGNLDFVSSKWNIDKNKAEVHLAAIQALEPAGVGARDLRECLLLQIDRLPHNDPLAKSIVQKHLKDLSENKLPAIAKCYGVTGEEVVESCNYIRALNPRPACNFIKLGEEQGYIWPEAKIIKEEGRWKVEFQSPLEPRLSINKEYASYIESSDEELSEYVKAKLARIYWLFQSLETRRINMEKVFSFVIGWQQDFLEKGPYHVRPLTMRSVAEQIGIHESTVSRIVSNKYIETPHGIIAMKCLFATDIGGDESASTIKLKLKDRIEAEDKRKPYTDKELVEWFQKQGVDLARRTIAKYREEMNIPASRLRKKHF